MVTVVLAGVVGVVLAVGDSTSATDPARQLSPGGIGAATGTGALAQPPTRPSPPYDRLFSGSTGATVPAGQDRLIRFGQQASPDLISETPDDGPCKLVEPANRKSIDPGIFMPPRDPQIDFKIRRIVPKGCIDPGIFIPKRRK